jgi:hypothetical protein
MKIQITQSLCKGYQDISHLIGLQFSILDESEVFVEYEEHIIPLHEEEYHILEM